MHIATGSPPSRTHLRPVAGVKRPTRGIGDLDRTRPDCAEMIRWNKYLARCGAIETTDETVGQPGAQLRDDGGEHCLHHRPHLICPAAIGMSAKRPCGAHGLSGQVQNVMFNGPHQLCRQQPRRDENNRFTQGASTSNVAT